MPDSTIENKAGLSLTVPLKVQRISDLAVLPTRGSEHAAGYDLSVSEPAIIERESSQLLSTGLVMQIPEGMVGKIHERSSLAVKGFVVEAGIIDSDYRGEVKILLRNMTGKKMTFIPGDRVAQIVIVPCLQGEIVETNELAETVRGEGGFGSTDKETNTNKGTPHVDVQKYMEDRNEG